MSTCARVWLVLWSLVATSALLTASGVDAQPPLTTCVLSGSYALSAALAFEGSEGQISGEFTFSPPGFCTAGALGTVTVDVSVLFAGSTTPVPFAGSFPYAVDASGQFTVAGLFEGSVGAVSDTGVANLLVFQADPAIAPPSVRFGGTAVRVGLVGVAGPTGATGPPGPNVLGAGSAGAPALSFSGDSNTGIFSSGADTLDFATGGVDRLRIGPTGDVNVLAGNLGLLNSTSTQGNLLKGGFLFLHDLGASSTGVGASALANNTGSDNTAVGAGALFSNTTGSGNTAVGVNALTENTTGVNNTATGAGALESNTIGGNNTATGVNALVSNDDGNNNTATGVSALQDNTSGNSNTATGFSALAANTTGTINTATGASALASNTTGAGNTALGSNALNANTTGNNNLAIGADALRHSPGGANNLAIGNVALAGPDAGSSNVALGVEALTSNNGGSSNVIIGHNAGFSATTGSNNTAVGATALFTNTTGANNTAVGSGALGNLGTGSDNIALGRNAGTSATGSSSNIYIGNAGAAESNTIRIGSAQTKAFMAGISGVTTGGAAVAVLVDGSGQLGTVSSSRRVKEEIQDMAVASAGLFRLQPVTFRYRQTQADGARPRQYGLIAEEVAEVYPELVQYSAAGEPVTVLHHILPALLLNELQKQQRVIETQQAELRAQATRLVELMERLQRLESREGPRTSR